MSTMTSDEYLERHLNIEWRFPEFEAGKNVAHIQQPIPQAGIADEKRVLNCGA